MSSPIFLNTNGATIPTPITPQVPIAFHNAMNELAINCPACTITSIDYRPFLAVNLSMSVWKKLKTYPRQNSNIRQVAVNNTLSSRLKELISNPVRLKIVSSITHTPIFSRIFSVKQPKPSHRADQLQSMENNQTVFHNRPLLDSLLPHLYNRP